MTFSLPKGDYIIESRYKETKLRFFSDLISLIAGIAILFLIGIRFVKPKLS
jgi:hypothetical protein